MKNTQEKTLKEIFSLLKEDKTEGVRLLYAAYYRKIYGIAFSVLKDAALSEDAAENVMLKFLTLEPSKFPTEGENAWLYRVVKNETISLLRKESKTLPLERAEEVLARENGVEEFLKKEEFLSLVEGLDDERKEVVSLKILGGYTHREIAALLQKKVSTVRWLYATSLKKLRFSLAFPLLLAALCFSLALLRASLLTPVLVPVPSPDTFQEALKYVKLLPFDFPLFFLLLGGAAAIIGFILKIQSKKPTKSHAKIVNRAERQNGRENMNRKTIQKLLLFPLVGILVFLFAFCGEKIETKRGFTWEDYSLSLEFSAREFTKEQIQEGVKVAVTVTGKNESGTVYRYEETEGKGVFFLTTLCLFGYRDEESAFFFADFPEFSLSLGGEKLSSEFDQPPVYFSTAFPKKVKTGEEVKITYSFLLSEQSMFLFTELHPHEEGVILSLEYALEENEGYRSYFGSDALMERTQEIPTGLLSLQIGRNFFANTFRILES